MKCTWSQIPGCCGAITLYGYNLQEPGWATNTLETINPKVPFLFASFINTHNCMEAYEILKTKFELLYQSDPEVNNNHGGAKKNKMFVCIYRNKEK